MAPSADRCVNHSSQRAGWRCPSHGALCPACVGERSAGLGVLPVCMGCGAIADPIRAARKELAPFVATLVPALWWALRGTGPLLLVLWGLTHSAARVFHVWGLARALLVAYLFHVTRWTAIGHDDVPWAHEFRGYFEDVVAPVTRVTIATLWFTVPVLVLLWTSDAPLAHPALIVAIGAAGLSLVPISLIASALQTPLGTVLNPAVLIGYVAVLGWDYVALLAFAAGCALLQGALGMGAQLFFAAGAIGTIASDLLAMLVPFAFFRALGLLLRARGADLGWGSAEDYLAPVLGEVKPQGGQIENVAGRGLSQASVRASAEHRGVAQAVPVHEQIAEEQPIQAEVAPIEIDEQPAALDAPVELLRLLGQADVPGALALLEAHAQAIPAITLSAERWFELGRAGHGQQRFRGALVALKRTLEVAPQGALAPQAWLLAARVYDEGLHDRAQSDRLLAELSRRFPQSQEGAFAARRLAAAAGGVTRRA